MVEAKSTACAAVEEALSEIVDGTAAAELYEHVAECDACRDLRHEATIAAERAAKAGADFRPPADFLARLQAAIAEAPLAPDAEVARSAPRASSREDVGDVEARGPATTPSGTARSATLAAAEPARSKEEATAPSAPDAVTAPIAASVSVAAAKSVDPAPAAPPAEPAKPAATIPAEPAPAPTRTEAAVAPPAPAPTAAPAPAPTEPVAKPGPKAARAVAGPTPAPSQEGSRRPLAVAAVALALAAAAGYLVKARSTTPEGAAASTPWQGKLARVTRASSEPGAGVEACSSPSGPCAPLVVDGAIAPGTTLRTDARTRAFVTLADGTEIALDRGSSLELDARRSRTARLVAGAIVADVASVDGASPAHLAVAQGDVEVLGTKLAIAAQKDRATVEVARGAVRVTGDRGAPVEVRAGEEVTIERGRDLRPRATTAIAESLEWSDRSPVEDAEGPALRGLGELKARRPGQQQEKGRAVRLARHDVKTRIVDVVARTEVDETFTNDTDEELEGIYRFPLPPGAQIERLALEVDGKLVDGAFVDRDKGAAIWRGVIQNAAPKAPKPLEEIIWVPGPWRDPALLEWQRGGRFELRIFPIPRRGSRRVVLAYTQTVPQEGGVRRYTYPLAHDAKGSTKVDAFHVDVQVLGADKGFGVTTRGYDLATVAGPGEGDRRELTVPGFVPSGDLTVEYALADRDHEVTAWAYRADAPTSPIPTPPSVKARTPEEQAAADAALATVADASPYVAIALRPELPRLREAKERLHVLVVDASRSMVGERFGRATKLAASLVREMDRHDRFVVLACDVACRAMPDGGAREDRTTPSGARGVAPNLARPAAPGAAAASDVERFLAGVEPDGGSDLATSMAAARLAAGPLGGRDLRVIYLGDGTPTVGPTRPGHLEAAVRAALPPTEGSVVAVGLGSDAEQPSLEAIARGGGGVVVPYVPGQRTSTAALDVLAAAYGTVLRDPSIELPAGLVQITPTRLDAIRAGGEAFVVARMAGDKAEGTVKLRGRVGGEAFERSYPLTLTATTNVGNAFVPRLFAAAKIAELERAGGDAQKVAAIALSQRFAVASRYTSLLVLESEAMFDAFGLSRAQSIARFTGEQQAESASADSDAPREDAQPGADKDATGALGTLGGSHASKYDGVAAGGRASAASAGDDEKSAAIAGPTTFGKGAGMAAPGAAATAAAPPAAAPAPMAAPPVPRDFADAPAQAAKPKKEVASNAYAEEPPPPPATKAPPRVAAGAPGDPLLDWTPPQRRTPPRPQRMIPMRKVWDRKGAFDPGNGLAVQGAPKLAAAEGALAASPDSRDRTAELFGLYATAGRLGDARQIATRWAGRDALDPDALVARADLAAREGDRDRAIRILSGLVDVRPADRAAQTRLASLYDAAGDATLACEHRVALADLAPGEPKLVADAIACSRARGQAELASLLEADAPAKIRDAITRLVAAASSAAASALRGDVQLSAEWQGDGDVDLALVDAQGRRISWLGATTKGVTVTARDATSPRTESLGLVGLPQGSYVLEVTRAASSPSAGPVRGDVTLRLAGETRRVPFVLAGPRAELGTVRVFFTSRLVPVEGGIAAPVW
jgi:hypothetical protein